MFVFSNEILIDFYKIYSLCAEVRFYAQRPFPEILAKIQFHLSQVLQSIVKLERIFGVESIY